MKRPRLCLFAACIVLASCGRQTETPVQSASQAAVTPAKRTSTAAFDHNQPDHAKAACESCHVRAVSSPSRAEPDRPPHAACSGCHSSENYLDASTAEPLCATCHPAKQILDASLQTRVLPFPEHLHQFGVSVFSHRDHMDAANMSPSPAAYACEFCHTGGTGSAAKTFPAHAECYSCHIHRADGELGRCENCHAQREESLTFNHGEGAAARDYHFQHSGHTKQRDGQAIACVTCHPITGSQPPRTSDISRTEPARGLRHNSTCWGTCHIQSEETHCGKCHVTGVPIPARAS